MRRNDKNSDLAGWIELPKSGLAVRDGKFYKQTEEGIVVASFDLSDISDVRMTSRIDFSSLVIVAVFAALAYVAKVYIPWAGLDWAAAIILGLGGFTFLATALQRRFVVVTAYGNTIYNLKDDVTECDAFAASLRRIMAQRDRR